MTTASLARDATVAVIGAGAMGTGIAQIAAQAGHPVRMFDTRMGAADDALRKLGVTFERLATKGSIDADSARAAVARIESVHTLADCVGARLVVEAIVEDLEAKQALFRELEVIVGDDTILAT